MLLEQRWFRIGDSTQPDILEDLWDKLFLFFYNPTYIFLNHKFFDKYLDLYISRKADICNLYPAPRP